jgi:DNA repair exonuclease SbcCD ATPase subunit
LASAQSLRWELDQARTSRDEHRSSPQEPETHRREEWESLIHERDQLLTTLVAAGEERARLESEHCALIEKLEEQSTLCEIAQRAKETADGEREALREHSATLRSEIAAVREHLEASRLHEPAAQENLTRMRAQMESLVSELASARREIESLAADNSAVYHGDDSPDGDLWQAWECARTDAEAALRRAEDAERGEDEANQRIETLEAEIKALREFPALQPAPTNGASSSAHDEGSPQVESLTAQLKEARFQADRFHTILNNLGIRVN